MKHKPRILVVEDEPAIAELIVVNLQHGGFHAVVAQDSVTAQRELDSTLPDAILLDWMLPGQSGLSLARQWRKQERTQNIPILMLTARGDEPDRVAGLDAGADDYMIKPFDLAELSARIAAVARRYAGNPNPLITLGALKIDLAAHAIHGPKGQIDLSQREWIIFEALLQRPGQIVSKSQIEDQIYAFDSEVESNTIEVYVSRLRKKLGKDVVQTLRGMGYRLGTP